MRAAVGRSTTSDSSTTRRSSARRVRRGGGRPAGDPEAAGDGAGATADRRAASAAEMPSATTSGSPGRRPLGVSARAADADRQAKGGAGDDDGEAVQAA